MLCILSVLLKCVIWTVGVGILGTSWVGNVLASCRVMLGTRDNFLFSMIMCGLTASRSTLRYLVVRLV